MPPEGRDQIGWPTVGRPGGRRDQTGR